MVDNLTNGTNPAEKSVTLVQQKDGWQDTTIEKIGGVAIANIPSSGTVKVSYDGTNVTFTN